MDFKYAFQIMHFLFFSNINAYKCHIINFLLTSFARYVQRNIGPRSFCTNLVLWGSVTDGPFSERPVYFEYLTVIIF